MKISEKEMMVYILNNDETFPHNLDSSIDGISVYRSSNKEIGTIMIRYLIADNKYNLLSYNVKISDYIKFIRKRKLSIISL